MSDNIRCDLLHPRAKAPTKGSKYAAAYDLFALDDTLVKSAALSWLNHNIPVNEVDCLFPGRVLVSTGVTFLMPKNVAGFIWDRSSLGGKKGIHVLAGVIDSDYYDCKQEVKVALINLSSQNYQIKAGDKIAQIVFQQVYNEELSLPIITIGHMYDINGKLWSESAKESEEVNTRKGGFGSTGV